MLKASSRERSSMSAAELIKNSVKGAKKQSRDEKKAEKAAGREAKKAEKASEREAKKAEKDNRGSQGCKISTLEDCEEGGE